MSNRARAKRLVALVELEDGTAYTVDLKPWEGWPSIYWRLEVTQEDAVFDGEKYVPFAGPIHAEIHASGLAEITYRAELTALPPSTPGLPPA